MGAVKTFTLKMKLAKKIKQNRLGGWSWAYLIIIMILFLEYVLFCFMGFVSSNSNHLENLGLDICLEICVLDGILKAV